MALAEKLDGTIKHHVVYGRRKDGTAPGKAQGTGDDIPHLRGVKPAQLAQKVKQDGGIALTLFGTPFKVPIPKEAAPVLAAIDGKTPVAQIARKAGVDPIAFNALWPRLSGELLRFGIMVYSRLLV